jgi:O-methyltransferase
MITKYISQKIFKKETEQKENSPIVPDMNFLRRVAMKETIFNVSTAVRFESELIESNESLKGDYIEFGVYQGDMFTYACLEAMNRMPWMRFIACDSFMGLPKPEGVDSGGEFIEGQFECSEKEFQKRIVSAGVPIDRVITIPGWFSETLHEEKISKYNIKTISIAYIDCDLYESCIPVLDFLTPRLRQGSVLMFDDWFCFRANPRKGIQLAVNQWLKQNKHIELISWRSFSSHGISFFVNILN